MTDSEVGFNLKCEIWALYLLPSSFLLLTSYFHRLAGPQLLADVGGEAGFDEIDEFGAGLAAVDDGRCEFGLGR